MRHIAFTLLILCTSFFIFSASPSEAVPILQLYIEGATYDGTTETWVIDTAGTFRLWAIGNTDGPGGKGNIVDVRLSAAYADPGADAVSITLTPTRIDGDGTFNGFTDVNTPGAAPLLQTVTDGSVPQLSDGSDLPSHGQYGPDIHWQEFGLGDFTETADTIGDFINSFPTPESGGGQINAYDITVTGTDLVHFDLYNSIQAKNKAKFAPFSHDAETDGNNNVVPEPSTLLILAFGLGLGFFFKKRRKI